MFNKRAKIEKNLEHSYFNPTRVRSHSLGQVSLKPETRKRSHSVPFFSNQPSNNILHDSFFNNRRKVQYETEFSGLFLKNLMPFMPVLKKVSSIILPDIKKTLIPAKQTNHIISEKMKIFLLNDFDLKILFNSENADNEMLDALQSDEPATFYQQMCLQFSYITFFTKGNLPKPELSQAVDANWCEKIDLLKLMSDMTAYRNEETLFKNYHRLNRNYIKNKKTTNIGILCEEDYEKTLRLLINYLNTRLVNFNF